MIKSTFRVEKSCTLKTKREIKIRRHDFAVKLYLAKFQPIWLSGWPAYLAKIFLSRKGILYFVNWTGLDWNGMDK